MAKLSFSFEKPYDEIEINGSEYKVYFDDESLEKYRTQAKQYEKRAREYLEKDKENLTEEEQHQMKLESDIMVKDFVNSFYGVGAYDKIYRDSGNSSLNILPLIEFTLNWLSNKLPDLEDSSKAYYTGKKKGKKK